jgi:hypothetical protein
MEKGSVVYGLPSLSKMREGASRNLSRLPDRYKKLRNAPTYPVELSPKLKKIKRALTNQLRKREDLPRQRI